MGSSVLPPPGLAQSDPAIPLPPVPVTYTLSANDHQLKGEQAPVAAGECQKCRRTGCSECQGQWFLNKAQLKKHKEEDVN